MKVVAVGDNCVDVYYKLNRFYPTGNAVDFAINLTKMGTEVALVSIKGNDVFGESVQAVLEQYGVDVSHYYPGKEPSAAAQMNIVNGDRVHEKFSGNVLADFVLTEESMAFVKTFDIIYSEKWSKIGRYIKDLTGDGRILVHDFSKRLTDPTNEDILPCLDYAFFSYEKSDGYIREFLVETQKKSGKVVIAMLGPDGSLAYDGKAFHEQKAIPVEVVNTVGAGDSYVAAFVNGLCHGCGLADCMRQGTEFATKIIQMFEPY